MPVPPTTASRPSVDALEQTVSFIDGDPDLNAAGDTYLPRLGFGGPPDQLPPRDDHFGGGDDDDDDEPGEAGRIDWCTVAVYWTSAEAHLARIRLEQAGVMCLLLDEFVCCTGYLSIAAGGVKLQVPRAQLIKAAAILRRRREDQVEIASFTGPSTAKMAACIVEAAQVDCAIALVDGEYTLVVSVGDDARRAATRLLESPFAAAVEPMLGVRPTRCRCGESTPGCVREFSAAARRRHLARVILRWLDRRLPMPLRPRRCIACGADRSRELGREPIRT